MRAKICGITNLVDAQLAVKEAAWALGFNFYVNSPRYIDPEAARVLIQALPASVVKVGIVIDPTPDELMPMMTHVGLDFIQVYEDVAVPAAVKQRLILCLPVRHASELPTENILSQYGYVLFDAPKWDDGLLGGTGRLAQWTLAAEVARRQRVILAGGLTVHNIQMAMKTVRPYAVDVASGVQKAPGQLDPQLLQEFLRQVNHEHN